MTHIATAGNAETAALQLIFDKGYSVECENEGECSHFFARKDDNMSFAAESPIELLGLITLGETWGNDWKDKGLGRDPWEKIDYIE